MAVSSNLFQSKNIHFVIRTPNQVYMQNLSQIGEPACPQIFDLAPFLGSIARGQFSKSQFSLTQNAVFVTCITL